MARDDTALVPLLAELNHWADLRGGPDVADTGEIGSRIQALVGSIQARGRSVREIDGRFELVPPVAPGAAP